MAAQENHIEIVRILLANHARQDLQTDVRPPLSTFSYDHYTTFNSFLPCDATPVRYMLSSCFRIYVSLSRVIGDLLKWDPTNAQAFASRRRTIVKGFQTQLLQPVITVAVMKKTNNCR